MQALENDYEDIEGGKLGNLMSQQQQFSPYLSNQICQFTNFTSEIIFDDFYNYTKHKTPLTTKDCSVVLSGNILPLIIESGISNVSNLVKTILFYTLPILTFILIIILVVKCKNDSNIKYTKFQDSDFYLNNVSIGRIMKPYKYINLDNNKPDNQENNVIDF